MNNRTDYKYDDDQSFDTSNPYIEAPWTVIESFYDNNHLDRLVRHQIESYNNFVSCQITRTIEMFNPVRIVSENDYDPKSKQYRLEITINFTNFSIYRPQIHENTITEFHVCFCDDC